MSFDVRVRHRFGDFLLDVEFRAPAGVTVLFGRSGAGKTSLLNAIAGLFTPDEARIAVDGTVLLDTVAGVSVPVHRRRLGCVFQDARLFPHLSVRQNLDFGARFRGVARSRGGVHTVASTGEHEVEADADTVVELLGLSHLLDRRPGALSGGEKQRVALGRALLSRPRALLMDEPLAALDDARKQDILPVVERLRDHFGVPIIYVSHAVSEVARLATTMVLMEDGRVVRQGPAGEVLGELRTPSAVGFSDDPCVVPLRARVESHSGPACCTFVSIDGVEMAVPTVDAPAGALVELFIPPAAIILSARGSIAGEMDLGRQGAGDGSAANAQRTVGEAMNALPVVVSGLGAVEQNGLVRVGLRIGGSEFHALAMPRLIEALKLEPGQSCHAFVNPVAVRVRIA